MKCEICHKNDATTAYTHIVDDTKKTLLLCASCVPQNEEKKKAVPRPKQDESTQSVPELIKKVKVEFKTAGHSDSTENTVCQRCSMTYKEFKKVGRLGCHQC